MRFPRAGAEEAVQGVRGGEGAQHHQRVRRPAGDLLQLQNAPTGECPSVSIAVLDSVFVSVVNFQC